ncbi:hypothetical protein ASD98_23535 [Flavobacterium sp. Root186]|nr:hypothetical protein ASD98_23535 [Flavobacterium sp. Root186]
MKHFKFIIAILLLLFSCISVTGTYKHSTVHKIDSTQQCSSVTALKLQKKSFYDVASSRDLDIHYKFKKKVRFRATTAESSHIKTPYYSKFLSFLICKSNLIYGVAVIYQIERHTHLHLYQLF